MISERERDEGKDLPVVGSVEEMKELMRGHEAHGLAFPAGVLRRPGRAPCEVVARDRLRALNVAEVALGFGHDAALFPAFLHGIDNEREPRLEPSLREGGRDAPELIGRVREPDATVRLANDETARAALGAFRFLWLRKFPIALHERSPVRFAQFFVREGNPVQALRENAGVGDRPRGGVIGFEPCLRGRTDDR